MKRALAQFETNIAKALDLVGLATAVSSTTTAAVDTSDIHRAAIVLGVSALDYLVHELTRIGMLQIADGTRAASAAYHRFQISMAAFASAQSNSGQAWFDAEIRERHGWLSFQMPDKIADALRYVTDKKLWTEVGLILTKSPDTVKLELKLIIDRRNKIAHEADMDPSVPGYRWPISGAVAIDALKTIGNIGVALVQVIV